MTEQFFVPHSPPDRKAYFKKYRQDHPDKVVHWRLTAYANTLKKAGLNVLTDEQLATMLADTGRLNNEHEV